MRKRIILRENKELHGKKGTRVYQIWTGIKGRCLNPKHKDYKDYGGRGIMICNKWARSFIAFYTDMGDPPKGYTIERKNNNGNYEPNNCKWIPNERQARNRRSNLTLELNGVSMSAIEWAEYLNMSVWTIYHRNKIKLPIKEILDTKPRLKNRYKYV